MQTRSSLGEFTIRVLVLALLVVLLLAAWRLRDALMLTFLAMIIAIALQVPVQRLEGMGASRGTSILITMGGLAFVTVLLVVLIVPVFVEQISNLVEELPTAFEQAREEYDTQAQNHSWIPKINWDQITEGDNIGDLALEQAGKLSRNIFPFLSSVGGVITNFVFIFFLSLFFVIDPANYLEMLLSLFPRGYRPRALDILMELGQTLRRWFVGQLISMAMLGTLITLVTGFVLGLENPIALGVISGLMEFVPNFGSVLSVIPAVIIALADEPSKVPWVILAYLVTQQIQSNLIMPRIMSRQISMPAAMVLLSQLIAAALFGFLGLLLAVPLAVVVMVIVREVYVFDVLNARPAQIEVRTRPDGARFPAVIDEPYRPEQLTPGEAAQIQAQGRDPFEVGERQIVEIITPASPIVEQAARGQQAVWVALLTLTAAQGMALIRTLLNRDASR